MTMRKGLCFDIAPNPLLNETELAEYAALEYTKHRPTLPHDIVITHYWRDGILYYAFSLPSSHPTIEEAMEKERGWHFVPKER